MRKTILLFIMMLLSICTLAEDTTREMKWQKSPGWKIPNVEVYVDANTLRHDTEDGKDYSYGVFMFHRLAPVEMILGNRKIKAYSFLRYYIVDCTKAAMLPISDYYFDIPKLPVITDTPAYLKDYTDSTREPTSISQSNPIYRTLCPKYI
jgi:hypothetical protein